MASRECKTFRPLISDFLDGELDPAELAVFQQHIDRCRDCREILEDHLAIRETLRAIPPPPPPPIHVTQTIWAETVEKPPPSLVERWIGVTRAQFGLSAVAALALIVIASAFFLVQGYERGVLPIVQASAPARDDNWPIHQPIRIEFNKPMDRASVEANLWIRPAAERDRLPRSWDGNTLIIGADAARSVVLLPDTQYTIMILPDARDVHGNRLGQTWALSFRTGGVSVAEHEEPEPTPTPPDAAGATSASPAPPTTAPESADQSGGSGSATATPVTQRPRDDAAAVPPTEAAEPTAVPTGGAVTSEPTPVSQPSPTPTPTQPAPTATATATPSPTPATAPTATATATPEPTPTPQPSPIPVTAAFGSVYWANSDVQQRLGEPVGPEVTLTALELEFQRGVMYQRLDRGLIYVMISGGTWSAIEDTWTPDEGEGGGPGPKERLWEPSRGFGKLWRARGDIASAIGYAVEPGPKQIEGRIQEFARGRMLYSDRGFVYVLYDDATWQLYADTSGRYDLLPPTPAPTTEPAEPTATPATETPTPQPAPSPTPSPTPAADSQLATPTSTETPATEERAANDSP